MSHQGLMGHTRALKRDHVIAQLEPFDGAAITSNDNGMVVTLNAANEYCRCQANIRAGFLRYKFKIYYTTNGTASVTKWARRVNCDGTLLVDDHVATHSFVVVRNCWECDWFAMTGEQVTIQLSQRLNTAGRTVHIRSIEVLFE